MAKSFISPGVFTNEIDVSFLGPGVGAIGASIIGTAPKGPAFVPITVTNFNEFATFFGDLNEDHVLGYAARAYLKNAGTANIVRVLGPDGRTVNGTAVTPGYTAESMWAVTAGSGSAAAVMALIEVTASAEMVVVDLDDEFCYIRFTGSSLAHTVNPAQDGFAAATASFIAGDAKYIKNVLNTDPTKFAEKGYYVREVYDYAVKHFADANAGFGSASYAQTAFTLGYNSGSTSWITSQFYSNDVYNLFRIHTLGHGVAENGRFKVSVANIRPSAAPSVSEFGRFDLELRGFDDTDKAKNIVESFPNLSMDEKDPNYICRVIGDKYLVYNATQNKMTEQGDFSNRSKFIRVEMTTGSYPDSALPWGFRGYEKPVLMVSGTVEIQDMDAEFTSSIRDLPLVADLLDKDTQSETSNRYYWGVEFKLSGSVKARLSRLLTMTGSDPDFSLTYVSGNSVSDFVYNGSSPIDNWKVPGTADDDTTLISTTAKFTLPIAFGFDGFDPRKTNPLDNEAELLTVSQLGTQAVRQAVDIISDPDFIDINMVCIPGLYSSRIVNYTITQVEARSDCFYVADISGSSVTAVVQNVQGLGFDSNYASVYYPGIKIYDDTNKKAKVLPASVAALGAIAYNDRVAYAWYAPAGLNRAGLNRDTIGFDVLRIEDQLTQADRDSLYENRINPIARFPDVPAVIWGQKTLQLKNSSLDRINVRRLLIHAKKLIASAAKFLVFEPNNPATQTRFKQLVNPILADIQQKQGLERFLVVMDSSNNTAESIDRNVLVGQIFLVPTRATEFVQLSFIVSPTGASFSE